MSTSFLVPVSALNNDLACGRRSDRIVVHWGGVESTKLERHSVGGPQKVVRLGDAGNFVAKG